MAGDDGGCAGGLRGSHCHDIRRVSVMAEEVRGHSKRA